MRILTTNFIIIILLILKVGDIQAQDITTGLVAHYKFENTSGAVIDETGNNNGVNNGATRGVIGKTGNAFNFDGLNDYVYIANSPTLNPSVFTLAYWVKSDGAQTGGYDRVSGFSNFSFDVAVGGSTNSLLLYIGIWYDTGYDLKYNTWTHIAVTYDGTTFKVYVNGNHIKSYTRTRTLSGNLYFASKYSGGECFDGSIDDARLYNRALSATDIQELFTSGGGSSLWSQNGANIHSINDGNVGIGTTTPDHKLTVNGSIHAKEVIIDLDFPAPDYVFEEDYKLITIDELKKFIDKHSHLPEFPPASKMETEGLNISEINMSLLKRIEELTLYIIEQEKRIQKLEHQYNFKNK